MTARRPSARAALAYVSLGFSMLFAAVAEARTPAEADQARIELIEQVGRSVVHVTSAPPADEPARASGAQGNSRAKPSIDELLEQFTATSGRKRDEEGSGFVIDSQRGLVLTAAHIADGGGKVRVQLADKSWREAEVAGLEADLGIAVLRTKGPLPPALPLDTRQPKAGETALIVGWMLPIGSVMALDGMVMGAAPAVNDKPDTPFLADYFALDATLPNGGFGGSPVVDREGRVIGMVSAIYGRNYGAGSITLAIALGDLQSAIAGLSAGLPVARGNIGATIRCERADCVIETLADGGPASAAGLISGDSIVSFAGDPVTGEGPLRRAIARSKAGEIVVLGARRAGVDFTVRVSIGGPAED